MNDDREIGRPGYRTDQIRHLTPGQATRQTPQEPRGYLRIRAAAAAGLAIYAWTWTAGIFNTQLRTTAVAASAAIRTARRSTDPDPDASDLSLTLATIARYASGAWLLYVIPTALYTMHAQGVGALLSYLFKTP